MDLASVLNFKTTEPRNSHHDFHLNLSILQATGFHLLVSLFSKKKKKKGNFVSFCNVKPFALPENYLLAN